MDYSLGLMVRKARCLHQKLKLAYSGRVIRRMALLVMLWTAPPPAQNAMDAVAVFLRNCAVHESLHGPEPPSLRRLMGERWVVCSRRSRLYRVPSAIPPAITRARRH